MRYLPSALILLLIGLWASMNPQQVSACSCVRPGSPSEELANSEAVFRGTVTSVREFERGDGTWSSMDPTTVEFDVTTVWKGSLHQTMAFTTARSSASCGFTFEEGVEYMVYSWDGSGVSLCSRTRSVSEAQDDLKELGEGSAPGPVRVGPTPDLSDYDTGGVCGIGASTPDVSWLGLMAGVVLLGLRTKSGRPR